MSISFDKAFGIHQYTLGVRAERAEVLASNIANADTPHYKARDVDFKAALANAKSRQNFALASTHEKHFDVSRRIHDDVKYRVPNQPDTGDGNTVDVQHERTHYLQNSLEYQTSFQFLNSKVKGLMTAIKGGSQ
jgi:flagellar basal-body rod protein FlgB